MAQDELLVNALVTFARNDMKHGMKKEDILNSLSRLINRDLFVKVKERL
jgi:hypothetical protein